MKVTVNTPEATWVLDLDATKETVSVVSIAKPEQHQSLVGKAVLWAMAEASQLMHGPLEDAAYQARIDACKACEAFDAQAAPQIGYCKACGCGQNARAELSVKARMPGATCPKNKWTPLTVATEAKS